MERAAKKGLLKKSSRVPSSKSSEKKKVTVPKDQPPHVAKRLEVEQKNKRKTSPRPSKKAENNDPTGADAAGDDGRFRF